MIIGRYPKIHHVSTHLNQFDDLVDWLGYLTSPEYLIEILVKQHRLTLNDAKARAPQIITHITTALSLINQSQSGPQDVSFLPAYYAILDLVKVYVLLGPRYADLPKNRWHGATYDVEGKDSRSLLTEVVTLKKRGTLPLFYEMLTGKPVTRERIIKMGDIYPYILDVSAEYEIVTKWNSDVVRLKFNTPVDVTDAYRLQAKVSVQQKSRRKFSNQNLAALNGFKRVKGQSDLFESPVFRCTPEQLNSVARQQVNCQLLYHSDPSKDFDITAIASNKFPMPEEFPIALLFFHMSSVVRYKPEFLEHLKHGKCWPLLASAKRHALRKFLLLFWSFIHNEQFIIHAV